MEIEGEMFEIGFGELRGFADGLKVRNGARGNKEAVFFFFEEAVLEWLMVLDIEMGKTRREIGLG